MTLSWKQSELTRNVTGLGALRMREAIRNVQGGTVSRYTEPGIKFYQASSSEMFGRAHEVPRCGRTLFHPRSPYPHLLGNRYYELEEDGAMLAGGDAPPDTHVGVHSSYQADTIEPR